MLFRTLSCQPKKTGLFNNTKRLLVLCLALSVSSVLLAEETLNANAPNTAAQTTGATAEINALINAKQHPYLSLSSFANRADDLNALYKNNNYALLWLGTANAQKNINDALKLLADASSNGLNSVNYDAQTLQEKLPAALALSPTDYKNLALYDTALSIALLRLPMICIMDELIRKVSILI